MRGSAERTVDRDCHRDGRAGRLGQEKVRERGVWREQRGRDEERAGRVR